MRFLLTPLLILFLGICWTPTCVRAQENCVTGTVTDDVGEPLIGAAVMMFEPEKKRLLEGVVAELDGTFKICRPHGDSTFLLVVTYTGYEEREYVLKPDEKTIRIGMSAGVALEEVVVLEYRVPLIEADATTSGSVLSSADIRSLPKRSVESVKGVAAGVASGRTYVDGVSVAAGPGTADHPEAGQHAPGQLTAGETNDFSKWELWTGISTAELAGFRKTWQLYPDDRYAVQLTYPGGTAAADRAVELRDGAGKTIWSARTDNRGRAELWAGLLDSSRTDNALELITLADGQPVPLGRASTFQQGYNHFELPEDCSSVSGVDVAFVVDATGSMGDEIRYLSSELEDVYKRVAAKLPEGQLRTAAVFYRDHKEEYLTRHQDFTGAVSKTISFVRDQAASGGGDHPEAVDDALVTAIDSLSWRPEAAARLLFLVLDAPPHQSVDNLAKLHRVTAAAAKRGVRVIPVVCSGMTKDGEYLLRSLALATNGTYVFLTDDSGIGGSHLEPTTDNWEVEKLNDLLVRLIVGMSTVTDCGAAPTEGPVARKLTAGDDLRMRVFPNPTDGPFTVKVAKAEGEVIVYDLSGKLLRRAAVASRKLGMDLTGLPSGTYLVRWTKGEKTGVEKVVLR